MLCVCAKLSFYCHRQWNEFEKEDVLTILNAPCDIIWNKHRYSDGTANGEILRETDALAITLCDKFNILNISPFLSISGWIVVKVVKTLFSILEYLKMSDWWIISQFNHITGDNIDFFKMPWTYIDPDIFNQQTSIIIISPRRKNEFQLKM